MGNKIATEKTYRINGEITAQEVRLIGVDNEQIGVVTLREAFRLAEEADVDIVEMSPTARPPVCRLMDYGKFRYAQQKKAHEAKLKQKVISVKEIKFRPGTDEGDYNIISHFFGNRAGICVNDGSWFGKGYEKFVRFNYGTSRELVVKAMELIKSAVDAL